MANTGFQPNKNNNPSVAEEYGISKVVKDGKKSLFGDLSDLSAKKIKNDLSDNMRSSFGSILSTQNVGKFISGARCTIKVNGRIAVFATSVSWSVRTDQDEIWTIDSTTPYEMAPKRISVEGTIGGFHIPGWTPSAQGIQSDVLSFMHHKYITIEVRDRNTDTLLFVTNKAVITDWTETITTDALAQMQLRWKAIGWTNEVPGPGVQSTGMGGLVPPNDSPK
jgi:hypothetical protein